MLVDPATGCFSTQSMASLAVFASRSAGPFRHVRTSAAKATMLNFDPSLSPVTVLRISSSRMSIFLRLASVSLPAKFMEPEKSRMKRRRSLRVSMPKKETLLPSPPVPSPAAPPSSFFAASPPGSFGPRKFAPSFDHQCSQAAATAGRLFPVSVSRAAWRSSTVRPSAWTMAARRGGTAAPRPEAPSPAAAAARTCQRGSESPAARRSSTSASERTASASRAATTTSGTGSFAAARRVPMARSPGQGPRAKSPKQRVSKSRLDSASLSSMARSDSRPASVAPASIRPSPLPAVRRRRLAASMADDSRSTSGPRASFCV